MKYLNFSNVEELIFHDRKVQSRMPAQFSNFEMWRIAKMIPSLRPTGQQAVLDFLNTITDEEQEVLEAYFDEKIVVEKLNYSISLQIKAPLNEFGLCEELCQIEGFNYFSTWRDEDFIYISFWR